MRQPSQAEARGRRRPGIRRLLLGVNAFVLIVPIAAFVMFRIYDTFLVRQTERRLIGEAAVLAEGYRDAWALAAGHQTPPDPTPSWATALSDLYPIEPVLDLSEPLVTPAVRARGVQPTTTEVTFPQATDRTGPAWRAGEQLGPTLDRVRRVNLSAIRLLDPRGCVVAASRGGQGECMGALPEVATAMTGRYAAVARERITSGPTPPLGSMMRRGSVRVFVAVPVFADGEVIGIVRLSRTSVDVVEVLWEHRFTFVLALLGCILLTAGVSVFFSRTIARPVRAIARKAEAVAAGDPPETFEPTGTAPAEVHRLAASLDHMTGQLTERARYIEAFAGDVSHELKTPITAIKGAAELLADAWDEMDAAQRGRFLSNIAADASRMERLTADLLALARLENAVAERQPTTAGALVDAAVAGRSDVVAALSDGERSVSLGVSPGQIVAALGNLIDNGLRHGAPVRVGLTLRPGEAVFVIADSGSGVLPEARSRVFDRFYTTTRDSGGTGLGLAIVKAVAEQHGGSVAVGVSPLGGASFELAVRCDRVKVT